MLYIISTPIGNLADISFRAIDVLKSVDVILCEDTRVSRNLLNHYEIDKPLVSYHCFNEKQKIEHVLAEMQNGKTFALISDAGTPLFQDPGYLLIEACRKNNISYTTIPGASSILSALVLSGFEIKKFQFLGFIPKKTTEAKEFLKTTTQYDGLSVLFESPKRTLETLEYLQEINRDTELCVIREMTKKFETVHRGNPRELIQEFEATAPRGEIVFVIRGQPQELSQDHTDLALSLIEEGLSKKTAYSIFSRFGFVDKDKLYKA